MTPSRSSPTIAAASVSQSYETSNAVSHGCLSASSDDDDQCDGVASVRSISRTVAARSARPVALPSVRGVVVVAPHPDDETLGAGGTVADLASLGYDMDVIIVSDGAASHKDVPALAHFREMEARQAAVALGVPDPQFLGFSDGHISDARTSVSSLLEHRLTHGPCGAADPCVLVIAPRFGDGHPDHEGTAHSVLDAVRAIPPSCRPQVWQYAIWSWRFGDVSAKDVN